MSTIQLPQLKFTDQLPQLKFTDAPRPPVRVLFVPVGRAPAPRMVEDNLEAMQALVGGYLDAVILSGRIILFCNEDGIEQGLPVNRTVPARSEHVEIRGDFFVTRFDADGNSVSLTDVEIVDSIRMVTACRSPR